MSPTQGQYNLSLAGNNWTYFQIHTTNYISNFIGVSLRSTTSTTCAVAQMRSRLAGLRGPSTAPLYQSAVVQQQDNSLTEVSKWMIIMIQGYPTRKFFTHTSPDMKITDRSAPTPATRMTDLRNQMNQLNPIVQQVRQVLQVRQVQPNTSTSTNTNTNTAKPQPQRVQKNTQMIQVPVLATVPLNRRLPDIITCLLPTHLPPHTQIPVTLYRHPPSTQNNLSGRPSVPLSLHNNSLPAVSPVSTQGRTRQRNTEAKSTTKKNSMMTKRNIKGTKKEQNEQERTRIS